MTQLPIPNTKPQHVFYRVQHRRTVIHNVTIFGLLTLSCINTKVYFTILRTIIIDQHHLNESVGKIPSLQDADETGNVIVTVFLIAQSVEHHKTNGVDVTEFTVGQKATHFLQSHRLLT